MNDADLEHLLRSVRPAGPRPELRARILEAARPGRTWPWLSAAAALAVAILCLESAAGRSYRDAGSGVAAPADAPGFAALRTELGDEPMHLDEPVSGSDVRPLLPELEIQAP